MNTSMNRPAGNIARAMSRSDVYGEMNAVRQMAPASANSSATHPTRRMFSARSAALKPRSLLSLNRRLSPSST
jgi:hypothetical protein